MEVTVIYSDQCPHCHELLDALEKQSGIQGMEIELVELSSEEAQQMLEDKNIDHVPTVLNSDGEFCEITYIDGKVEFTCPT